MKIEISTAELEAAIMKEFVDPVNEMGLIPMYQQYHDGWLLHCYDTQGNHKNTVGGATLEDCIKKLKEGGNP